MNRQASDPMRMAVILACHNRRPTTVRCLERLFACSVPDGTTLDVILIDDGSTDGTAEAVADRWPEVRILSGDGSLFWAGATRWGMEVALAEGVDAHLWLNDDVVLYPDALEVLVDTYRTLAPTHGKNTIVVGSMQDPETGETTYGGVRHDSTWHPLKFARVEPGEAPVRCDTMNGNLVLIPRVVVETVGVLSDAYVHAIGDFAYGFEARRAGASIWICPGHQGACGRNEATGTWEDPSLPLRERLRKLRGPKGLPPRAYARLARLSGARAWPMFVALPYVRVAVTSFRQWATGLVGSSKTPSQDPPTREPKDPS